MNKQLIKEVEQQLVRIMKENKVSEEKACHLLIDIIERYGSREYFNIDMFENPDLD